MSKKRSAPARRRRADAERSAAAVLDAAIRVLGERADAGLDKVAAEAGVSRQTVYAHYSSRTDLLHAVLARVTDETLSMLDEARLEQGSPTAALLRFLDHSWRLLGRYPFLLDDTLVVASAAEDRARHAPLTEPLERLVRRGQREGDFDASADPGWLTTSIFALGHAAGGEVGGGRMTLDEGGRAFRTAVLRVLGVAGPPKAGDADDHNP